MEKLSIKRILQKLIQGESSSSKQSSSQKVKQNPTEIRRRINREASQAEPYLIWNAFVDLLAMSDYDELAPVQQKAYLVFWYDSEVQNGGHFQFFENQPDSQWDETLRALGDLKADCHQKVFEEALARWRSVPREKAETIDDFVEEALEEEFVDFDDAYYECTPTIQQILEEYLAENTEDFIEFED